MKMRSNAMRWSGVQGECMAAEMGRISKGRVPAAGDGVGAFRRACSERPVTEPTDSLLNLSAGMPAASQFGMRPPVVMDGGRMSKRIGWWPGWNSVPRRRPITPITTYLGGASPTADRIAHCSKDWSLS